MIALEKHTAKTMEAPDVDIVILWVDGADEYFTKIYSEEMARLNARGIVVSDIKARHRDNGELFFLLRSIHQNIAWYRNIYIVTNGQKPKYVDFNHPRIKLVTHQEIFPNTQDAPSFNTFAIESVINRIPSLSENYIRFSDDFFLGRKLEYETMAGADGLGKYLLGIEIFDDNNSTYQNLLKYNAKEFGKKFGATPHLNSLHAPQLRNRNVYALLESEFEQWFSLTRSNKLRSESCANSLFMYPYFSFYAKGMDCLRDVCKDLKRSEYIDAFKTGFDRKPLYRQLDLGYRGYDWQKRLKEIQADRPQFFNLNDQLGKDLTEINRNLISGALYELFPAPSPFEISDVELPIFARLPSMEISL